MDYAPLQTRSEKLRARKRRHFFWRIVQIMIAVLVSGTVIGLALLRCEEFLRAGAPFC